MEYKQDKLKMIILFSIQIYTIPKCRQYGTSKILYKIYNVNYCSNSNEMTYT